MSKVANFLEPELAIFKAIEADDSKWLTNILTHKPALLNQETPYAHSYGYPNAKWRPIHYATFCCAENCVKQLIAYEDLLINGYVNDSNCTALFYAVNSLHHPENNGLKIIELLLQHPDMDVNTLVASDVIITEPHPVVFEAMESKYCDLNAVTAIVTHDSFDPKLTNYRGETLLSNALLGADIELVKLIAPLISDINCQDQEGKTVLQFLIALIRDEEGYIDKIDALYEITEYLLDEFDVDFTKTDNQNQTLTDYVVTLQQEVVYFDDVTEEQIEKCSELVELIRRAVLKIEQQDNNNNPNPNQFFQLPSSLGKRKNNTGDKSFNL